MLKNGGFLMLDDVEIPSPSFIVFSYTTRSTFAYAQIWENCRSFKKLRISGQLDEWHLHPYIEPLSFGPDRALHYYAKFIIKTTGDILIDGKELDQG
jgi:hypothetical protein